MVGRVAPASVPSEGDALLGDGTVRSPLNGSLLIGAALRRLFAILLGVMR